MIPESCEIPFGNTALAKRILIALLFSKKGQAVRYRIDHAPSPHNLRMRIIENAKRVGMRVETKTKGDGFIYVFYKGEFNKRIFETLSVDIDRFNKSARMRRSANARKAALLSARRIERKPRRTPLNKDFGSIIRGRKLLNQFKKIA